MPKLFFWSTSIALACVLLLGGASAFAKTDPAKDSNILLIKYPPVANPSMPKVLFNHDAHEAYVDARQGDCSNCHKMTKEGLSTVLLNVRMHKENKQVSYMHTTCTDCHRMNGKGPLLAQCRSCHVSSAAQAMK